MAAAYEQSIVTFLDILGFRDLVMNADPGKVNEKLQALEKFAKPTGKPAGDPDETDEPTVLQFSDTIVRIRRTETKWNRILLRRHFLNRSESQGHWAACVFLPAQSPFSLHNK